MIPLCTPVRRRKALDKQGVFGALIVRFALSCALVFLPAVDSFAARRAVFLPVGVWHKSRSALGAAICTLLENVRIQLLVGW